MKKKFLAASMAFFTALLFLGFVQANAEAASMPFSVEAVIPENQIDKRQTYFDLQTSPGQTQVLVVKMKNDTDAPVTVEVHPNAALTNDNGVVEYSKAKPKVDKTMKYPFSDLAKTETEVTIPAKSTINKEITLTMPTQGFDGVIVGGIYFQEKIDKDKEAKSKSSVQIRNRYAYVIGVNLMENANYVKPNMKLLKITPSQVNFRNTLKVNLQNPTMTPIKKLKVDGKVFTRNGKEILHETVKSNLTMAPNTNFNYGINWDNKEFKPGRYRLEMTAKSGEHTWKWKEYFTIDRKVAQRLNKKAINLEKDYTMWYIIAGIILLLLIFLIIFIIMHRRNKKEKEKAIEEAKRQLLEEIKNSDQDK